MARGNRLFWGQVVAVVLLLGASASAANHSGFEACTHELVLESPSPDEDGILVGSGRIVEKRDDATRSYRLPSGIALEMNHLVRGWETCVDSFELGRGRLGLHLGGADIWDKSSLGADVFLLLDGDEVRVLRIFPGSQRRAGPMTGCRPAKATRFFVADIDADGYRDLGREVREIKCQEEHSGESDAFVPVYEVQKIRWSLQGPKATRKTRDYDGRVGIGMLEIPPLGIKVLPVDVVLGAWVERPGQN